MLPRSRRLPRAGFEQFAGLRKAASRHFSIAFSDSAPLSGGAVVVSKKIAKKSVDRHQMKQKIREIIRPWCVSGRTLIVFARPGAAALPFQETKSELEGLLRQSLGSGSM